ncbi:hypothetical protein TF3313_2253 [Tannerella forsythia 3313]|nr:hypothetical protein TF3313_2253 [Tannerella forsythia 3313]
MDRNCHPLWANE